MGRITAPMVGGMVTAPLMSLFVIHHLTAGGSVDPGVIFLDRPGGGESSQLRWADGLQIEQDGVIRRIACAGRFSGGLIESYDAGTLPELILVATNPAQIDQVLSGLLLLLEWMRDEGTLNAERLAYPYLLFVTNGIYFNRLRYRFVEVLERAMMEGQLPDLWPNLVPFLVSRLLRGPKVLIGQRTGRGAAAIYHPGAKGLTARKPCIVRASNPDDVGRSWLMMDSASPRGPSRDQGPTGTPRYHTRIFRSDAWLGRATQYPSSR